MTQRVGGATRWQSGMALAVKGIFARQPLAWTSRESDGPTLRRTLGWPALTAIGLGTMLGGIFPTIGAGAHAAGPGVILAYVLSGFGKSMRRAVLRRICVDGAGRGQRVYLRVRDAWRSRRVGDRLGLDSRVRALGRADGVVVVGIRAASAQRHRHHASGLRCRPAPSLPDRST